MKSFQLAAFLVFILLMVSAKAQEESWKKESPRLFKKVEKALRSCEALLPEMKIYKTESIVMGLIAGESPLQLINRPITFLLRKAVATPLHGVLTLGRKGVRKVCQDDPTIPGEMAKIHLRNKLKDLKDSKNLDDFQTACLASCLTQKLLTYFPNPFSLFADTSRSLETGFGVCSEFSHMTQSFLKGAEIESRTAIMGLGIGHYYINGTLEGDQYYFDSMLYNKNLNACGFVKAAVQCL